MILFIKIFYKLTHLQKVDLIVSNPPYVLESEKEKMQENVLDYEPELALFVEDKNPLIFYKKIASLAINFLMKMENYSLKLTQNLVKKQLKCLLILDLLILS